MKIVYYQGGWLLPFRALAEWQVVILEMLNELNFYFRVRLISLAAQKFVSDIANDALQHCKMRGSVQSSRKSGKVSAWPVLTTYLAKCLPLLTNSKFTLVFRINTTL